MADEKVFVFHNDSLPTQGFSHMEEIRRHGKLCDVTLKVSGLMHVCLNLKNRSLCSGPKKLILKFFCQGTPLSLFYLLSLCYYWYHGQACITCHAQDQYHSLAVVVMLLTEP